MRGVCGWACHGPDVAEALQRAMAALAALGAEVIDVAWDEAALAAAAGFAICRPELAAVHEQSLRATPERFNPVLRARLEAFSLAPARDYVRARRARTALRRSMARLYHEHGLSALLLPTTPATATLVDAAAIVYGDGEEAVHSGFTRNTMPFNTTGQPALSLPGGYDRDGLPIGMQIVGRPYGEATICAIGRMLEGALAGERRYPAL